MASLTFGLLALACTFVVPPAQDSRLSQLFWAGAFGSAVAVFLTAPNAFAEVLIWALAALVVWLLYRGPSRPEVFFALIAGGLLASAAPYLGLTLGQYFDAPPLLAASLVTCLAILAGTVLCGVAGGVMALISAALALGQFAQPLSGTAVLCVGLVAMLLARSTPRLSSALPLVAPLISFIGGAST